jgi:hypothetical protein
MAIIKALVLAAMATVAAAASDAVRRGRRRPAVWHCGHGGTGRAP